MLIILKKIWKIQRYCIVAFLCPQKKHVLYSNVKNSRAVAIASPHNDAKRKYDKS